MPVLDAPAAPGRKHSMVAQLHTPRWWESVAALRRLPLFAALGRDDLVAVASALVTVRVAADTTIYSQDSEPTDFYLLLDGSVAFFRSAPAAAAPDILATLEPGQFFGEVELIAKTRRLCGTVALTPAVLQRLPIGLFFSLLGPCVRTMTVQVRGLYPFLPELKDNKALADALATDRPSAAAAAAAAAPASDDRKKREQIRRRSSIHSVHTRVPFLRNIPFLASVPRRQLDEFAAKLDTQSFVDGDLIVFQDEPSRDIYVLEEGDAVAFKRPPAGSSPVELRWLEPGDYFGEIAFLTGKPRTANVVSYGSSRVLRIPAELADTLPKSCVTALRRQMTRYRSIGTQFVNSVSYFSKLKASERSVIADALQLETYNAGRVIISDNSPASKMYFLVEGEVIFIRGDPPNVVRTFRKKGDYFGEYALLLDIPRTMSAVAGKTTRLFSLHRALLHVLMPCQSMLLERIKQYRDLDAEARSDDHKRLEIEKRQRFLAQVPILASLSKAELERVSASFEPMRCSVDTHIVRQGHPGNAFFVVQSGSLVVYRDTEDGDRDELGRLQAGDFFGEVAMLTEQPRVANVLAMEECVLLRLRRSAFARLLKSCHMAFIEHVRKLPRIFEYLPESRLLMLNRSPSMLDLAAQPSGRVRFQGETTDESGGDDSMTSHTQHRMLGRRASVCAEKYHADEEGWTLQSVPKSDSARQKIAAIVKRNVLMSHLDVRQLNDIADAMFSTEVAVGEEIIQQGTEGDNFYIVDSGKFDVYVFRNGKQEHVATVGDGGSFGELALLYNCPRAATVRAAEPSLVWALDRITFRRIIIESSMRQMNRYELFLEKVPILAPLNKYERLKVAEALQPITMEANEPIIRKGEQGDAFFILEEGEGLVYIDGKDGNEEVTLKKLGPGDYFGEIALIMQKERCAHVKAVTPSRVLRLPVDAFNRLLGPCEERLRENLKLYKSINETFVELVHILAVLTKEQRQKVADALEPRKYKFGEVIIREGEKGDRFFIIKDGQAAAYKVINGAAKKVKWYTRGDYFGEIALITSEPRKATVIAKGSVECLTLSRDHFNDLLGDLREEMIRNMRQYTAGTAGPTSK